MFSIYSKAQKIQLNVQPIEAITTCILYITNLKLLIDIAHFVK